MESVNFTHDNNEYLIKVTRDDMSIHVKVFHDDVPANRFSYSAHFDDEETMKQITGIKAIEHLVEIAKSDVINGIK